MKSVLLNYMAVLSLASSLSFAQESKPNILIIYADDLAPLLGAYGHPIVKSPNIDAFAEEAVVFDEAHCNVTICTASRTSILTGVRPSTSGLKNLDHDFKTALPDNVSMPMHFKNNGYFTQAMGKIADIRGGDWTDQWDDFHFGYGIKPDLAITALNNLKNKSEPWLLAVGFSEPHCAWRPGDSYTSLYDGMDIQPQGPGRTIQNEYQADCYAATAETDLPQNLTEELASDITLRYYATVSQLDDKVGAVLDATRDLGLYDNTIIIFWSGDHGFHLGENDWWGKWKTYRASTWIPMIMRVPGHGRPGTRTGGLVETVDMYPTLVDLAGLPQPASELEGYSFVPLLDVPDQPWKKAVFTFATWGNDEGIKTPQYNYMTNGSGGDVRLYDNLADPKETTNIAQQNPDVVAEMEMLKSDGWREALPDNPISLTGPAFSNPKFKLVTSSELLIVRNVLSEKIEILNLQGSIVKHTPKTTGDIHVGLSTLENGMYIIRAGNHKQLFMLQR